MSNLDEFPDPVQTVVLVTVREQRGHVGSEGGLFPYYDGDAFQYEL